MTNSHIQRFLPTLFELVRSKKLSQGQKDQLNKSIKNLNRALGTRDKKSIVKEVERISKIMLELIVVI
jgi:hypothetical protein